MNYPRQYSSLCIDRKNSFLYVVGGYNKDEGLLPYWERLSLKSKQWEEIEILNVPRLNSCSAALDGTHVYTFGGLGEYDYLSSIERYNIKLNIWTELKVKMPLKLSNSFAWSVNKNEIIILGGMRPTNSTVASKRFVIENTVYSFNAKKYSFAHLKPLPFTKKLSNVVYNGNGKIFCYIIHRNYWYPQILMYNLNKIYPEFDRYAFNNEKERWAMAKHKGKITRITSDYNFNPDLKKVESIDEIDKPKRNQVKDKKTIQEEQVMMQEMKELSNGGTTTVNFNNLYRNLKMQEDKESMIYDSLGEIQQQDDLTNKRLYRKYAIKVTLTFRCEQW